MREAFDRSKKKWPEFTALMVLSTMYRGEADEKLVGEAIDLVRSIEKPDPFFVEQAVQVVSMGLQQREALDDELRKNLRGALLELYPQMPKQSMATPWSSQMVIGALAEAEE